MKKLGLTIIALSALLLSGCGGGKKYNQINDKKYVVIFTEVVQGRCESTDFRTLVTNRGFGNFITKETQNNTSCATYGKKNDGNACAMEYIGGGNKNCVLGFDTINGQGKETKVVNIENLNEMTEIISSEL